MSIAIKIENVSKQYRLGVINTGTLSHDLNRWWTVNIRRKEDPYLKIGETNDRSTKGTSEYVWALKDINMEIEQGDVVGIIGKNGAGKSTLLKLLSRVTQPTTGTISYSGRIASLLEVGTGFHPEMTGRENIYMNGAIMGMSRAEVSRKLDEIVDFAGVERYLDTPVKRYSSGMTVRLGFAIAAHLEPEILVVDEVLAVGDAEFQKKAIGKMKDVSKGEGRTVLFVSHNMTSIKQLCKSGILLENGMVSFSGTAEETVAKYLAINNDEQNKPLLERSDRYGNGKIYFSNVVFRNVNGDAVNEVFVGQPLTIEVHFVINDLEADLNEAIIACGITDEYSNSIVSWVSDEMEHDFSKLKEGHFSIAIPSLNLRPHTYYLSLQFSLGSTEEKNFCDKILGAAQITVLNDDIFTKGMNLKTGRTRQVLLPARFI
ncbi:MAG: ABC transporter ATP-binding protein [Bacteroidales bacterium]|nr:ABC transporter ATP-binding protein [Bacteroidales bacterium]